MTIRNAVLRSVYVDMTIGNAILRSVCQRLHLAGHPGHSLRLSKKKSFGASFARFFVFGFRSIKGDPKRKYGKYGSKFTEFTSPHGATGAGVRNNRRSQSRNSSIRECEGILRARKSRFQSLNVALGIAANISPNTVSLFALSCRFAHVYTPPIFRLVLGL
jgi:hypothetical protein